MPDSSAENRNVILSGTAGRAAPADRRAETAGSVFLLPMPIAATEAEPETALAALAARTASDPEEPWLFYRHGLDWHWRSWIQVADQVARGAAALANAEGAVSYRPRQDPDTVAVALAIQAAGTSLAPSVSPKGERGPESSTPSLPECRSRLDLWQPRTVDLDAAATGTLAFAADAAPVSQQEILAEAASFDDRLPTAEDRWILCATPALTPRDFQIVLAWTLRSGAAWVLEPEPEAFHETVLWARPSVVLATTAELERLSAALTKRQHRRHSRIRVTVDIETPRPRPLSLPPSAPAQGEGRGRERGRG